MPENAADAIGQFCSGHAVEQVGVDRILAACEAVTSRIRQVLVDAGTAYSAVDDADRHVAVGLQVIGQIIGPIADEEISTVAHRVAPGGGGPAIGADPGAVGEVAWQTVDRERVGLAVDDIGIAANQVGHSGDQSVDAAGSRAKLQPVYHLARRDRHAKTIGPAGHRCLAEGLPVL